MDRVIKEEYNYINEVGELQFQVVRTEPKGFFQRRHVPGNPTEWVYQLGECWYDKASKSTVDPGHLGATVYCPAVRNVPYRLLDLRKNTEQPIIVVEGERKADLLASLGFTATCSAKGAGKWPVTFGGFLANRDVVVMNDNDEVGELHAAQVAGSALLYGCNSIRMVKAGEGPFQVDAGGDIYDLLMAIGRPEDGIPKLRQARRAKVIDLVKAFPKMERSK